MADTSSDEENRKPGKQRVLIAVDASCHAQYALLFYQSTLHNAHNQVLLMHCSEPPYVGTGLGVAGYGYATGSQYDQMLQRNREDTRKLRQRYESILKDKNFNYELVDIEFGGNPGEAIVKVAKEQKADMIVVGTRGLGKLRRTILGSVSDFVLTHAHCPVLVCHDPEAPIEHYHQYPWRKDKTSYHYTKFT